MWTSKYRPTTLSEIVGNRDKVKELKQWADDWDNTKQAVVLYGPPGVGKTSSAHALANQMKWEVMEMNASDRRTGSIVERIAGESSKTASLTGKKRKLIILDEADNLHGNSDRGGKGAMTKVIKETEQPIILIANDFYELSRTLRRNTKDIEFSFVDNKEIAKALRDICVQREMEYETEALKQIATNADGDLRGAINDLHKHAAGDDKISKSDVKNVGRDQKEEIFPFLDLLLKEGNTNEVRETYRNLDMNPNDLFRWVDQNIDREYTDAKEMKKGMDSVSRADVWLGKVIESQNYKLWRYASDQLTAGVASAKNEKHGGWTRWQPPRYSRAKGVSDELVTNISETTGCSMRTTRRAVIPYLSAMIPYCKPRTVAVSIAAWYKMNAKDLAEISGSGKNTNKVQSIIEDAREKQSEFDLSKGSSVEKSSPQELTTSETENQQDEIETVEEDVQDEQTKVSLAETVSRASSVGSKTAEEVSKKYDSIQQLASTTVKELSKVNGVSGKRAERIKEVVSDEATDESGTRSANNSRDGKNETQDEELVKGNEDSTEDEDEDQAGIDDFI